MPVTCLLVMEEVGVINGGGMVQVPLETAVRESCDSGVPVAACDPNQAAAKVYVHIARKVLQKLEEQSTQPTAGPDIVIRP